MINGTCLNVRDRAPVRVIVGAYAVEVHCAGTEIEMDPASLAVFISTAEEVLPQLRRTDAAPAPTPCPPTDVAAEQEAPASSSTWVICDADDSVWYMILNDLVEIHWDEFLVWSIQAGALARLLDRARLAQAVLDEHVNRVGPPAEDHEIPDAVALFDDDRTRRT